MLPVINILLPEADYVGVEVAHTDGTRIRCVICACDPCDGVC
jgi:hypothetical protein